MQEIMTSRLLLQPFTIELMQALIDNREAFKLLTGLDLADDWPNSDLLEALPFICAGVQQTPALAEWSRLLVLPSLGRAGLGLVIGEAGFKNLPDSDGAVEIGYGLAASYRRNGYATEAVRALCDWARSVHNVRTIRAECYASNAGSVSVLRKAGFVQRDSVDELLRWEMRSP